MGPLDGSQLTKTDSECQTLLAYQDKPQAKMGSLTEPDIYSMQWVKNNLVRSKFGKDDPGKTVKTGSDLIERFRGPGFYA